jgi:hypothetical protein
MRILPLVGCSFGLWLAAPQALASTLVLSSDRPVVILVNALPHTVSDATVTVPIKDGVERANVTVLNLLGQRQYEGSVSVAADTTVYARWEGRSFTVVRRVSDAPAATPEPAEYTLPEPPDAPTGPDYAAIVASSSLGVAAVPAEEASPPATGRLDPGSGPGTLLLVNRNTTWTNVRLDGELYEFRGEPRERELTLTAGPHAVEVWDFQDLKAWWRGTVLVYAGQSVELQFSQHEAPWAVNRPDAWTNATP